jgi:hypothetical protein
MWVPSRGRRLRAEGVLEIGLPVRSTQTGLKVLQGKKRCQEPFSYLSLVILIRL